MRKAPFHHDAKWWVTSGLILPREQVSRGWSLSLATGKRRQKQGPFSCWMLLRRHEVRALFRQVDRIASTRCNNSPSGASLDRLAFIRKFEHSRKINYRRRYLGVVSVKVLIYYIFIITWPISDQLYRAATYARLREVINFYIFVLIMS